jgi:hypothetical protein
VIREHQYWPSSGLDVKKKTAEIKTTVISIDFLEQNDVVDN